MEHITVYREPGRYAGWPANYGVWAWGDEIVVGFTVGYHDPAGGFHARDRSRPFVAMQARSLDGGRSWVVGPTPCRTPGGRGLSADEHVQPALWTLNAIEQGLEHTPTPCPGDVDFTQPDFALMCGRTGLKAGARSWFYISFDRCRAWEGPYRLPMFGYTGIAARTDYLVSGPGACTLFLTAAKANGDEGRVFCARTTDGGQTFARLAEIGPEPAGYAIMPASLRLSRSRILCAMRCCQRPSEFTAARHWIDLYASDDDGRTWGYVTRPVADTGSGGNPPTLTRLHDGRLCMTYGFRGQPFGIRARLSADEGLTWRDEIILRDDGGSHDLGYPRTVQRPDGELVTVYYFNDRLAGEAYIAATLWRP
ncbi:MAG: exo-alpha-sialidase [Chloroflexi bacterium]|nr:exo-alpha-sialidase [Chloroflexota bacterium]